MCLFLSIFALLEITQSLFQLRIGTKGPETYELIFFSGGGGKRQPIEMLLRICKTYSYINGAVDGGLVSVTIASLNS